MNEETESELAKTITDIASVVTEMKEKQDAQEKKIEGLNGLNDKRGNEIGEARKQMASVQKTLADARDDESFESRVTDAVKKVLDELPGKVDNSSQDRDTSTTDTGASSSDWSFAEEISKLSPELRKIGSDAFQRATPEQRLSFQDKDEAKAFINELIAANPAEMSDPFAETQNPTEPLKSQLSGLLKTETQKSTALPHGVMNTSGPATQGIGDDSNKPSTPLSGGLLPVRSDSAA